MLCLGVVDLMLDDEDMIKKLKSDSSTGAPQLLSSLMRGRARAKVAIAQELITIML